MILALRKQPSAGLADDRLHAIYCATLTRDLLENVDWGHLDLARVLDEVPGALIKRSGRAGELQPLDLTDEPDLAAVVATVEAGLRDAA